jgi:hypothetical protein
MAGPNRVIDPDSTAWTVRRRWLPWRRALSLRSLWHSTPDNDKPDEPKPSEPNATESGNLFLTIVLGTIGGLIWLVITAGKAVLILLAAGIAIALSVTDLILQLLVMPFVLLARASGVMRWPVEIERDHRFVRTEFAAGFDAAAALRDELSTQIQRGELATEPVK